MIDKQNFLDLDRKHKDYDAKVNQFIKQLNEALR